MTPGSAFGSGFAPARPSLTTAAERSSAIHRFLSSRKAHQPAGPGTLASASPSQRDRERPNPGARSGADGDEGGARANANGGSICPFPLIQVTAPELRQLRSCAARERRKRLEAQVPAPCGEERPIPENKASERSRIRPVLRLDANKVDDACDRDASQPSATQDLDRVRAEFGKCIAAFSAKSAVADVHAAFAAARILSGPVIIAVLQMDDHQAPLLASLPSLLDAVTDDAGPLSYIQCGAILGGVAAHLSRPTFRFVPTRIVRRKWIALAQARPQLFLDHVFDPLASVENAPAAWVSDCIRSLPASMHPALLRRLLAMKRLGPGVVDMHLLLGQNPASALAAAAPVHAGSVISGGVGCDESTSASPVAVKDLGSILAAWTAMLATEGRTVRMAHRLVKDYTTRFSNAQRQALAAQLECGVHRGDLRDPMVPTIIATLRGQAS